MGSIMVNSVLGLGGLGVAKLVLGVSQFDCSCLSETCAGGFVWGLLDFHTYFPMEMRFIWNCRVS